MEPWASVAPSAVRNNNKVVAISYFPISKLPTLLGNSYYLRETDPNLKF